MSGIWLSGNRASDEGGWFDFIDLRNRRVIFAFDIAAIVVVILLVISGAWIGIDANEFVDKLNSSEQPIESNEDNSIQKIDGRWPWEAKLLLDTCTPLNGTWQMPETLANQDEVFWYPGEVECVWEHQGIGDRAVIAIRNAADSNQEFVVNLSSEAIGFGSTGDTVSVEANESNLVSLVLNSEPEDEVIYATIVSTLDPNASIQLKITIIAGAEQKNAHVYEGQRLNVHYRVYIYDTGELLDESACITPAHEQDLPVTAGNDGNYILGFGWGQVGLDADFVQRGLAGDGTTHTVLLPPDLAYKNRDDRPEANNQWLQFELTVNRLYV